VISSPAIPSRRSTLDARRDTAGEVDALLGLDLRGRPTSKSEVYGELLIDDFQVEKRTSGDLEPDEVGFLVGSQWADPGGLEGITLGAEYTGVQ
jgi:hypothetical protein